MPSDHTSLPTGAEGSDHISLPTTGGVGLQVKSGSAVTPNEAVNAPTPFIVALLAAVIKPCALAVNSPLSVTAPLAANVELAARLDVTRLALITLVLLNVLLAANDTDAGLTTPPAALIELDADRLAAPSWAFCATIVDVAVRSAAPANVGLTAAVIVDAELRLAAPLSISCSEAVRLVLAETSNSPLSKLTPTATIELDAVRFALTSPDVSPSADMLDVATRETLAAFISLALTDALEVALIELSAGSIRPAIVVMLELAETLSALLRMDVPLGAIVDVAVGANCAA